MRDSRRKYPKEDVVTQRDLTELLLAAPNEDGTKSLPADGTTAVARPADIDSPTAFTEVLAQVHTEKENVYSPTRLPPAFPSTKPQHILKLQKGAVPTARFEYFPMENFA